ncbi:MAG: hypothetical protein M9909_08575 [Thermomicrobiales bacterium]|nr:hypothetical protein [Thermomicrobiales bacterium]
MATDPTRSIRAHDHPSVFDYPADALLDHLANLPSQYEVPYLTVTLDWSVDGDNPGRSAAPETKRSQPTGESGTERPSLRAVEQEMNRLIEAHGPRGEAFDALQRSKERISSWLRDELDPSARGVYIVAHEPSGVLDATGLNLPIETSVSLSVEPRLYSLIRIVEDYPTYAVLQIDQQDATLSFITHGARDRSVKLESTLFPRKQSSGGLNQKRYRRRAEERMEAFARDTIVETEKALAEAGVDVLILAGNDVMISVVRNELPDHLAGVIVDHIRMEPTVAPHEKVEMTIPIAEAAERRREQASVDALRNAIGGGALGVAGPHEVLRALQNGQVETLILCDTFEGSGWADYEMHVFGVNDVPAVHPTGGDTSKLVAVDLRDELVRLALSTGAEVDIIHSSVPVEATGVPAAGELPKSDAAAELVEMGGVGAILRYAITAG